MFDRLKNPESTPKPVSVPRMTLTISELTKELNISKPTALRLVKEEDFPSLRINKKILIDRQGLQEWMKMKTALPKHRREEERPSV